MKCATSLLFLFVSILSLAQRASLDSLNNELENAIDNSQKLRLTTLLAKEYAETHSDSALLIINGALNFARANALDSALGQIYIAYSTAYSFLGQYDSAMKFSFLALRKSEEYSDTVTMIDAFNNIGIDNMYQEEDDKSIEYFMKVENLSRIFGDSLRLGHALNNIGMMHGLADRGEVELAYYKKASSIFLKINEIEGYANTLLNIGTVFTARNEYNQAEGYYQKSIDVFEQLNHTSGIQNTLQSWAENAMKNGQTKKAKELGHKALLMAKKYSLNQDVLYTYDLLGKIALKNNDFRTAYEFEIKEAEIREELFTKEKANQISELETKYETEKKEAEIARLSLENDLKDFRISTIAIGGGVLIVILIVLFVLRSKRLKVEAEAQEFQIEALKKQLMELNATTTDLASNLDFKELNGKLHTPLTEREFDALKLSVQGKTNSEIAEELFITNSTVKFHLRNTYSKMGVVNRKEAFQYVAKTS